MNFVAMDVFLIVYQKCLFQHFFSEAVLEYLTDHKDLHVLLNFWINERAFIILFQNFNSMSGYKDVSVQSWSPK